MKYHVTPTEMEIASVDMGADKLEPLCGVGRNVQWCSCYGKQHESSYKIKNRIYIGSITCVILAS
jgi:hypothetical protein